MSKFQPKKTITKVKLTDDTVYGKDRHRSYPKTILQDAPIFPKPLEYEDIDNAMFNFVDEYIPMVIKGKSTPTFTLYSNQRFSEYSQSWEHTDEDGNLLMNFKTISRENNPKPGANQGGYWNIPGNKRHTLLIRDVLEDNGEEAYEIYSMGQPFAVDLTYRISIITDLFENINAFNQKINDLFKARQCYIRPNGHFLPVTLEEINDNTEYTISERKFYNQTVTVKVMAYIISADDFKIEKKPKRIKLFMQGDVRRPKPEINIDEFFNDKIGHTEIELTIDFQAFHTKTNFDIDTDFIVERTELYNIRNYRLSVNDTPYYTDKGFTLKNGDNIKIFINHLDPNEMAQLKFIGYNPISQYVKDELPLKVSDDIPKFEDIGVEEFD